MTKDEFINSIAEKFNVDFDTAKKMLAAKKKFDFACFCSYMADYDCPSERVAAEKEFREVFPTICDIDVDEFSGYVDTCDDYSKHFHGDDGESWTFGN